MGIINCVSVKVANKKTYINLNTSIDKKKWPQAAKKLIANLGERKKNDTAEKPEKTMGHHDSRKQF